MCKNHMHRAYDGWLEEEDNNDRIVNGQVPVSEKRISLIKWLGNAWDHVCAKMDFERLALKTGSGLAKDLSNQKDIKSKKKCFSNALGYTLVVLEVL